MSVVRFWWYGSDLYLYYGHNGLTCCGCKLSSSSSPTFGEPDEDPDDRDEILTHLCEHVAAGHVVPVYVFAEFGAEHPNPEPAHAAAEQWERDNPDTVVMLQTVLGDDYAPYSREAPSDD